MNKAKPNEGDMRFILIILILGLSGYIFMNVGLQGADAQSSIWTTGIGPAGIACYCGGTYPSQADIEQDSWDAEMYYFLNNDYVYVPYRPYDYNYGWQTYGYNQLTNQYPSWAMPYRHSWRPY
jgi:hypothetical protein